MRKFIAFGPAMVVLITVLATLVAAPAAVRLVGYANTDVQVQLARHELETENVLKQIDRAVRAIADAVEPSVVHIGVEEVGGGYQKIATGSGWVFDKQGLDIVTNSHVVHDATRITVQFNDGRAADAEVVGQDTESDIAVLKVSSTEGLFPAERASGLELHQGDRVYAFGSPFGFKFSMSEGIISGLGRDPRAIMRNSDGYTNFIQTDAAVNPGNSGGPLVNVEGKVVGMNVAIATSMPQVQTRRGMVPVEGQNSGISFAIPLATIDRVVEQLISGGMVARGFLGISRPMDDDENRGFLEELKFHGRGVVVTGVEKNSPAAKGGLQASDVITKLNSTPVTSVPELRSVIANFAPGDKVKVEVSRAGEVRTIEVELGRLVTQAEKSQAAIVAQRFGIADVDETSDGRIVLKDVLVPSAAYNAGLRPNARILNVNGAAIHTIDELYIAARGVRRLQRSSDMTLSVELAGGQRKELKLTAN